MLSCCDPRRTLPKPLGEAAGTPAAPQIQTHRHHSIIMAAISNLQSNLGFGATVSRKQHSSYRHSSVGAPKQHSANCTPANTLRDSSCHRASFVPRAVKDATAVSGPPVMASGPTALLHALGDVGEISPAHLPWLLRLGHCQAKTSGGDSTASLQVSQAWCFVWCMGNLTGCTAHADVQACKHR